MARLEDLRQAFLPLSWADKLAFIEEYRKNRYNDLNTVQEFDLSAKTKSTKAREPKAKKEKKPRAKKIVIPDTLSAEQRELLAKLGIS